MAPDDIWKSTSDDSFVSTVDDHWVKSLSGTIQASLSQVSHLSGGSVITVGTNYINIVNLDTNEDRYYYKDYGQHYFDLQFKHELNFSISSTATDDYCCIWAVSNVIKNIRDQEVANDPCIFLLSKSNGNSPTLALEADAYSSSDNEITLSPNTKYFLRIRRNNAVVTLSVYSNEARTTLVDSVYITLTNWNNYRYLYGMSSYNTGAAGKDWNGTISKLDLRPLQSLTAIRDAASELQTQLTLSSPDIPANKGMNSTIESVLTVDTNFKRILGLSSTIETQLTIESYLRYIASLSGNVNTQLTATAPALYTSSVSALTATIALVSLLEGTLSTNRGFSTSIEPYLSIGTTFSRLNGLSSTIETQLTSSSLLTNIAGLTSHISEAQLSIIQANLVTSSVQFLNSTIALQASLEGNVTAIKDLSGNIDEALLSVTADLLKGLSEALSGNINAVLNVSADIGRARALVSEIEAQLRLSGLIPGQINISGGVQPSLSTTSNLSVIYSVAAHIVAQAILSGDLETAEPKEILYLISTITKILSKKSNIDILQSYNSNITTILTKKSEVTNG